MNSTDTSYEYRILAELSRRCPHVSSHLVADTFAELLRLARRHRRICEKQCNGDGYGKSEAADNATEKRDEQRHENIETKARALAQPLALVMNFQHDPRGATFRLSFDGSDGSGGRWLSGDFALL